MAPFSLFFLLFFFSASSSQQLLYPSQFKALLRLQRILEFPHALSPLSSPTAAVDLCSLPPSSTFSLSCSASRLSSLSVAAAAPSPALSPSFSTDSLFTTLAAFPSLSSLSLVSLGLSGPLPAAKLRRLRSLRQLNLSSNLLSGPLPSDLRPLAALQLLDLSSNRLAGPAPSSLFSLPALQHLDLSANRLVGVLPANLSCSRALRFVDLSANRFLGPLPPCLAANTSGRVVLDAGNCLASVDKRYQRPSSQCAEGALAAVLPPVSGKSGSKSKLGLILGVVGGVVGGAAVLGFALVMILRRSRRVEERDERKIAQEPIVGKDFIRASPKTPRTTQARHMSQAVRIGTFGLTPYRVFTTEELEEATNYFDPSNLIGDGPQGQFYKGWLRDGSTVALRCLKLKQKYSATSLAQYMDAVSRLRHRHLVSILGHCIVANQDNPNATDTVFLVFEFVSNGTLRSHLTEWRKREMLKWPQRVAAVIGVARGVQFLHTATVPGISGNDLRIENVLLDETLTAKISNYNLPVLPKSKNNKVVGSESPFNIIEDSDIGSVQSLEHGEKEDVCQLGLILVEIITGKPAESETEVDALKLQLQKALNDSPTKLQDIADPTIRSTFAYDSLRTAIEVALNCISKDHRERPSIDDVLWNLQYSVQVQDGWASSGNLSSHVGDP